ncbi:MAG: 6-phosphofructokinase [Lachnospiraceae bacterium]|nr:6-phosphofructokinase [Lachnospiraceae bacterium]
MSLKNIIVGQSGGPTAVINASLCGVIREGLSRKEDIGKIYGMIHGVEGFLEGRYMDLGEELGSRELELLRVTPAAYLGSCRFKLPEDMSSEIYPRMFAKFEEMDIGYFFYIGGNDSMDTVSKLSRYGKKAGSRIRFVGIPKTIDNDLVLTDHTPGFGSAARYVASAVREIVLDSSVYQQKSVTIIEVMGRHTGWLTASSVLARKYKGDNPALVYLPEHPFSMEGFERDVERELSRRRSVVVCVSEGIGDKEGRFICEYGQRELSSCLGREAVPGMDGGGEACLDNFGHKMLTGCGKVLERFVKERFGVKVRSVELNVGQRCCGTLASLTDVREAERAGQAAVSYALEGESGIMVAFIRKGNGDFYELEYSAVDVNQVCNQEKKVPVSWILKGGNDVGEEYAEYALPLIRGAVSLPMENGIPQYLYRKQIFPEDV